MKKIWKQCLAGVFGLMVCGTSAAWALDASARNDASEIRNAAEETLRSDDHAGLTPRGKARKPAEHAIILAQHPAPAPPRKETPPPAQDPFLAAAPTPTRQPAQVAPPVKVAAATPMVEPSVTASTDPYVYNELERLAAELAKVAKATKKPDDKKGWAAPKVSGRLFLDSFSTSQNDNADDYFGNGFRNKAGVREMQIAISGKGFDSFDYKLEFSVAPTDGKVNLVDNWIGVKNLPLLGYVRAGHFKPETGLNYPASALHTTLTEFTGPSSTFGFGRRFGVAAEETFCKDRIRLFYGVFQEGATNSSRFLHEDNQGQVFNMRLSAAPIFEKEGKHVFHVGGHWSYASTENGTTSLKSSPGSISWYSSSLDTGSFAANHYHRGGVELAYQRGAFAVQSEAFVGKYADYKNEPSRTASGAYVELKYFLTGDYRTYDLKKGMFGAAKVRNNFHPHKAGDWNLVDGFGAWQAVVQWSYLDLGDWRSHSAKAGRQHDLTLGLNWFWTPNIRWVFEYVHSQQNVGSQYKHCYEDIFGTSLRVHF